MILILIVIWYNNSKSSYILQMMKIEWMSHMKVDLYGPLSDKKTGKYITLSIIYYKFLNSIKFIRLNNKCKNKQ